MGKLSNKYANILKGDTEKADQLKQSHITIKSILQASSFSGNTVRPFFSYTLTII